MFDGTDLSLAYGSSLESLNQYSVQQQPLAPMQPPLMEPVVSKGAASHAMPPDPPYNPPPAMYAKQPAATVPPAENFWDRLGSKKWDVIKMVLLGFVVLLGISLDRIVTHYMTAYIGRAFLTDTQEFLIRLSYPVLVILAIWLIKAA